MLKNSVILFYLDYAANLKTIILLAVSVLALLFINFLSPPIQRLFNRLLSAVLTLWENIPDIFCKIWRSVQERKTPVHWQWFPTAGL